MRRRHIIADWYAQKARLKPAVAALSYNELTLMDGRKDALYRILQLVLGKRIERRRMSR